MLTLSTVVAVLVCICWFIAAIRAAASAMPAIDFFFLGWALVALDFVLRAVH